MRAASTITELYPQNGVYLIGYVGEDRNYPAKGVHDTPLAVSLLLEINHKLMLFLSIDVIMIQANKIEVLKRGICDILPIEKDNIIINAIHSHSAPNGFNSVGVLCNYDNTEYFTYAVNKILGSLKEIENHLEEVEAIIGHTKVHGFYSNRNDINKPFDDTATLIKFMNQDKVVAAICNFNCHATVLGVKNMQVSSDLIGAVRSRVGDSLGVIPYTFTGASGDISNRQYRQGNDFKELDRVGEGVAKQILDMDNFEELVIHDFDMKHYCYAVKYDNKQYYETYQKALAEANSVLTQKELSPDIWKLKTSEKLILESKLTVEDVDFEVRGKVINLDSLTIVTFPGELASKFGIQLRNQSKNHHFLLIGYADDYQGYFIEEEEYGHCYETIATDTPKGIPEEIIKEIGGLI